MRYAIQKIEALKKELDQIPPAADGASETSLLGAIRILAPKLEKMRTRGHRMDALVKHLAERDVTIKPNTLKAYLQRISAARRAGLRRNHEAGARREGANKALLPENKPGTPSTSKASSPKPTLINQAKISHENQNWQEPDPTQEN